MSAAVEGKAKIAINVNSFFSGGKVNAFQGWLFLLATINSSCDGYDLFVYAGAIPLIMRDFHINPAMAGALATYMLVGATLGSLILSPLADRIGRKTILILCIVIFSIGMFGTGLTHGAYTFLIWRFIAGIGVGGSLPNISALVNEFLPGKKRGVLMSLAIAGIHIGSLAAAVFGLWLFPHYGWRSVFYLGGLPILAVPLYMKYLPESPVRLFRTGRFAQLRTIMRRARPDVDVPDDAILQIDKSAGKAPFAAIFAEGRALSTVMFWVVYFTNVYVIFGFTIWLPKLIMDHGFSLVTGLTSLLLLSITSIVGSWVIGVLGDSIGMKPTLAMFYALAGCSIGLIAFTSNYVGLMILVSLAGAGFNGAQNCMNAFMPAYFPPSMRSTATGLTWAIGRVGGFTGPILIGVLMSAHFSYQTTVLMLAFPSVISVIGLLMISEKYNFARQIMAEQAILSAAEAKLAAEKA